MPTLGDIIKQERLRKGLTRQELASKVGQTESYLADIENGYKAVGADEVLWLADALGLPVQNFFPRSRSLR